MKTYFAGLGISCFIVFSLVSCSLDTHKQPTESLTRSVTEKTPPSPTPQEMVSENPNTISNITVSAEDSEWLKLRQKKLQKDPIITRGFIASGSCIFDEQYPTKDSCMELSVPPTKKYCETLGGQWQASVCNPQLYEIKCKDRYDAFAAPDKDGVLIMPYSNRYYLTKDHIVCVGIEETI